jgi:hypothetical protein
MPLLPNLSLLHPFLPTKSAQPVHLFEKIFQSFFRTLLIMWVIYGKNLLFITLIVSARHFLRVIFVVAADPS